MQKLYIQDSYQICAETYVVDVITVGNQTAISVEHLLYHPNGGGQPDDRGDIQIGQERFHIDHIVKKNGQVYLAFEPGILSTLDAIVPGDPVVCYIDWEWRYSMMRSHTCAHIGMAAARQLIAEYEAKGMQIAEDGKSWSIRFRSDHPLSDTQVNTIVSHSTNYIDADEVVESQMFPSLDAATEKFGSLFRIDPNLTLKGKIRVISINSIDANPCSGTHIRRTGEIGAFSCLSYEYNVESGLSTLSFALAE